MTLEETVLRKLADWQPPRGSRQTLAVPVQKRTDPTDGDAKRNIWRHHVEDAASPRRIAAESRTADCQPTQQAAPQGQAVDVELPFPEHGLASLVAEPHHRRLIDDQRLHELV